MMRKITGFGAVMLLQLGLHACTPGTNVPGTDLYIEAADGKYHGPMESLRIEPSQATLEVSVGQAFQAIGVFEDGTEVGVTEQVSWQVSDEAIAAKAAALDAGALPLTGLAPGQTQIEVALGTLSQSTTLDVIPAALTTLEVISEEAVLGRGGIYTLKAMGTYRDAHTEDLTAAATWTTSDETILEVRDAGEIKAAAVGQASITAKVGEVEGNLAFEVECRYPADAPQYVSNGGIMPYMYWDNAQDAEGNISRFDLEDVHCGEAYKDTKTLIFQVSAVWCVPCRRQLESTNRIVSQLNALGAQTVYLEAQNLTGRPIGTVASAEHIDEVIPGGAGIRLGDLDARPISNIFSNSPNFIEAFPTVFVVRTRDMKIIANAADTARYSLDMLAIAEHPDWNWSDPDNPIESFVSKCEAGKDEVYEPNDTEAEAAEVGATVVDGGICTDAPDYYRINIPGRWRVTLLFSQAIGDLDVYVWNENTHGPLMSGGSEVGSFGTRNNEVFEYEGEQLIRIQGKRADSAPYQLYIEAL